MNVVSGVIGVLDLNRFVPVERCSVDNFSLVLSDDTWLIGFDQSTSNTGIALLSTNMKYVILLDLHRDKHLEKKIFYRDFYRLIVKLVSNKKVKLACWEKPVPNQNQRYTGTVLTELKGKLEEWCEMIDELADAYQFSQYPQSWKANIIDKSKGTGRFNEKACIAEDLVDRFPILQNYYVNYPYTDYDSFDALGILLSVLACAFDDRGYPTIYGDVEKTHVSFVCYKYVSRKELDDPDFLYNLFGIAYYQYEPIFRSYNKLYPLYKNVRMASSSGKNYYTILPQEQLSQFQWQYGIDPEDDSMAFLMFVFKRGNFSKSEINTLKCIFEWNEEIYGER